MTKEELLCQKYNKINQFLAIHGVRPDDRDDLLQEAFLNAFRALENLRDIEKIEGWLWIITANVVRAHYGKTGKESKRTIYMDADHLEEQAAPLEAKEYGNLIREIDRLADRETINEAFRCLDESTKILFFLHYFLGYPFKDIATMQQMNYSTLKSNHHRGLKKMKKALQERSIVSYE